MEASPWPVQKVISANTTAPSDERQLSCKIHCESPIGQRVDEEALAKAELAQKIIDIVHARRLTQSQAAHLLKVDQPKISALTRGRLSGFSIDRLLRFLMLLGHDIEITVKTRRPRSRSQARLLVA